MYFVRASCPPRRTIGVFLVLMLSANSNRQCSCRKLVRWTWSNLGLEPDWSNKKEYTSWKLISVCAMCDDKLSRSFLFTAIVECHPPAWFDIGIKTAHTQVLCRPSRRRHASPELSLLPFTTSHARMKGASAFTRHYYWKCIN